MKELLTVEELAKSLDRKPGTITAMVRSGKIPFIAIPGFTKNRYRFELDEVEKRLAGDTPDSRAIWAARRVK